MNVLIVDDDPTFRRALKKALQSYSYEVCAATNGGEAWESFVNGSFSLVITDWMMPGFDGLELCRRIRAAERHDYVYIIMVTSRCSLEDLVAGMNAGADDFIVKPLRRPELEVRVRAAERILRLERELREKNERLEEINARLRHLSRFDSLMQIGNRLAFEEKVSEFHQRALRYGTCYGVVICDVDHFKSYNDTFGHPAGDEVLRRVANTVSRCLRCSDSAYRYGGEEIVVLLPEQSLNQSATVAERLRATVESLKLPRPEAAIGPCVTISCGVSAYPAEGCATQRWEPVIEWADQALYRAKALGRNRVQVAEVCPQPPRGSFGAGKLTACREITLPQ